MNATRRQLMAWLMPAVAGVAAYFAARPATIAYRLRVTAECRCKACQRHAENKVFADAASVRRAHVGCKCAVETFVVNDAQREVMFVKGREHDRRA